MAVAEAFLKENMTRERNRRIVNSETIVVEAWSLEKEEETIMTKQTRNTKNATIERGTVISIMCFSRPQRKATSSQKKS